jgi:hypothetical protein
MPVDFLIRPRRGSKPIHRLDADKIIETSKNLADEIRLRLPGSNLPKLALRITSLTVSENESETGLFVIVEAEAPYLFGPWPKVHRRQSTEPGRLTAGLAAP